MKDMPKHSVSVAGVVINEASQVLLIQRRDNGHWEPPGGVLKLKETFESGVRREIKEETGIVVAVETLSGVYKNMQRGIVAIVFRCNIVSGAPCETEESMDIGWFSLAEATSLMTEAYAVRVQDAFKKEPNTRVHNGVSLISTL